MELELVRNVFSPDYTLGEIFLDGSHFGYTCEDCDRHLENGGEKVYGRTAIHRGKYRVIVSWSNRFKKPLPELLRVPKFSGVRIHGGNSASDSLGCILLGDERTADGVRNCSAINKHLAQMIEEAEMAGEECWITIR